MPAYLRGWFGCKWVENVNKSHVKDENLCMLCRCVWYFKVLLIKIVRDFMASLEIFC